MELLGDPVAFFCYRSKTGLVGISKKKKKLASWEASPETSAETLTRYGRKICGIISKLTSRETLWKTS
jgi:hypothetical protein